MVDTVADPGGTQRRRVLIVEDSSELAFGLKMNLEIEGYEVLVEGNGAQALPLLGSFQPDLIILDLTLPGGLDGLQLLSTWRESDSATRIIVLSARGSETDRVTALRLGADDYICKPFSLLELLLRVRQQLYRHEPDALTRRTIHLGNASIDLAARTVTRRGTVTQIPAREFALLSALVDARGAVVSKSTLLTTVWGHKSPVKTNTVEYHVTGLRRKIEDNPRKPKYVLTASKAGYRLKLD